MSLIESWEIAKDIIKDVVNYGLPMAAFIVSIISLKRSSKSQEVKIKLSAVETKLQEYELKLREYRLEQIEDERSKKEETCVEARLIKIASGKFKLKIWNSGSATAYKIDFQIPVEYGIIIMKNKVPFEFLEPGKNFEEHAMIHHGSDLKFKIVTYWEDGNGNPFSKEMMGSV